MLVNFLLSSILFLLNIDAVKTIAVPKCYGETVRWPKWESDEYPSFSKVLIARIIFYKPRTKI